LNNKIKIKTIGARK